MPATTPDGIWTDYHARKRAERLEEAETVWRRLTEAGVDEQTVLVVEFVHFGPEQANAEALARQLSEHYTMSLESAADGYWRAKGTTRPYGITLTAQDHGAWVEFMCDVARSHGCVFSTWMVEAPALQLRVDSEAV